MVAADVGSTDDPQALAFWQSSDVLGFSDYQRLFMFLEHGDAAEQEAGNLRERSLHAPKAHSARLWNRPKNWQPGLGRGEKK